MRVVHAHGWVVIDCRVPQESVIRIVSTMGTKESISYKMISHGSWYRQIEREGEQQPSGDRERRREGGRERKSNSQVKRKKKEEGSTRDKKKKGKRGRWEAGVRRCRRVEVSEREEKTRESEMESVWKEEGEKRTSKSNEQTQP